MEETLAIIVVAIILLYPLARVLIPPKPNKDEENKPKWGF